MRHSRLGGGGGGGGGRRLTWLCGFDRWRDCSSNSGKSSRHSAWTGNGHFRDFWDVVKDAVVPPVCRLAFREGDGSGRCRGRGILDGRVTWVSHRCGRWSSWISVNVDPFLGGWLLGRGHGGVGYFYRTGYDNTECRQADPGSDDRNPNDENFRN